MNSKINNTEMFAKVRNIAAGIGLVSVVAAVTVTTAVGFDSNLRDKVFFSQPVQDIFSKQIDLLSTGLAAGGEEVNVENADQNDHVIAKSAISKNIVPIKFNNLDSAKPLNAGQRQIVHYISKRYRISSEAVESIVRLAWKVGKDEHIEPTLILAIVGVESSYNPFAASSVGAKGLMQVMPKIHKDKFERLAQDGNWSALNPEMNMRVGAQIIKEYTRRTGSVQAALRWYVGAAIHGNDGGYPGKVLKLKAHIDQQYREGRMVAQSRQNDKVSAATFKSDSNS